MLFLLVSKKTFKEGQTREVQEARIKQDQEKEALIDREIRLV